MAVDARGAGPCGRGGAFDEPRYLTCSPTGTAGRPLRRHGLRCMRPMQADKTDDELRKPIIKHAVDYSAMDPIGDAAYAVLAQQLDYRQTPFTPRVEAVGSTIPRGRSSGSRCRPATTTPRSRCSSSCRRPAARRPASSSTCRISESSSRRSRPRSSIRRWAALCSTSCSKSGWALAVVAFDGAYERQWSAERTQSMGATERIRMQQRHSARGTGRAIDYLTTREDINARQLGWFGVSYGAAWMLPLLAVEKRIGAAVLYSGGAGPGGILPASEQAYNYLPRVTQPVLMLNGRYDIDSTPAAQQALSELLGSPASRKTRSLFESRPRQPAAVPGREETLEWFDRHLAAAR